MKHKEKIKRNIRDLSYLPREDGKRLEKGMFFRSGSLYKASPRFVGYIKEKGIIDLRTPGEIAKKPDIKIESIRYIELYPQSWTSGGGVFFMKYTLEFKLECVETYKRSHSYVYPPGIKSKGSFVSHVQDWVRLYDDYLGVIGLMA